MRKDSRPTSKATATWLGSSAVSKPMSMETKPCTAFVCCPVEVWKFSAGRAKKAR